MSASTATPDNVRCAPPTLATTEKERLDRLLYTYTPPNYLRKEHKDKIKEIKSLQQGRDGKTVLCCLCGTLETCDNAVIHHWNHKVAENHLENVDPAHRKCNDKENALHRAKSRTAYAARRVSDPDMIEKPRPTPTLPDGHEPSWASKEGAQGEVMRAAFNKWRRSGHGGWMNKGEIQRVSHIAAKAVYACSEKPGQPLGSDQTYTKYIHVDAVNGIYDTFKERGVWMAQYVGELDDRARLSPDEVLASETQWRQADGPSWRDVISKGAPTP